MQVQSTHYQYLPPDQQALLKKLKGIKSPHEIEIHCTLKFIATQFASLSVAGGGVRSVKTEPGCVTSTYQGIINPGSKCLFLPKFQALKFRYTKVRF